jgi:hypothetical protein
MAKQLANESPLCLCLSRPVTHDGVEALTKGTSFEEKDRNLWDLGVLTKELLL